MVSKSKQEVAVDVLASFLKTLTDGFETDKALETEKGVKFDYGKYGKFICKRAIGRNAEYAALMSEKFKSYDESQGQDVGVKLLAEVYVETIIFGLETPAGVSIPYTDEAKAGLVQVFCKAPDLFTKIQSDVTNAENFLKANRASDTKN